MEKWKKAVTKTENPANDSCRIQKSVILTFNSPFLITGFAISR